MGAATAPTLPSTASLAAADEMEVLRTLLEATEAGGGEMVCRAEAGTGRVFFAGGRVAWAVASTVKRTFGTLISERASIDREALRQLFDECKQARRNFGEEIVARGLLDEPTLRKLLLEHLGGCLLEILSWRSCQVLFLPEERPYSGTLLFSFDEVLDELRAQDTAGRLVLGKLPADQIVAELRQLPLPRLAAEPPTTLFQRPETETTLDQPAPPAGEPTPVRMPPQRRRPAPDAPRRRQGGQHPRAGTDRLGLIALVLLLLVVAGSLAAWLFILR